MADTPPSVHEIGSIIREAALDAALPLRNMAKRTLNERLRGLLGPEITEEELENRFLFKKVIGSGATAKVYAAVDRKTGDAVAIKVFDKAQLIEQRKSIMGDGYAVHDTAVARVQRRLKKIIMELEIVQKLDHPNIVRYLGGYETSHRICIVHELVEGHDLLEYVLAYSSMDERQGAYVFEQLLQAIKACHALNVWHRDLKLENVLVTTDLQVKLIDFGLSEQTAEKLQSVCGTPLYCSPELLFLPTNTRDSGVWGAPADLWSAAILLFALLTGCAPFNDSSFTSLREDVYRNEISYPGHLSESVVSLFQAVLVSDPEQRPSIDDLLAHPWVVNNASKYKAFHKSPKRIFYSRQRSSSATTETEESSTAGSSFDENGSYRDLLYDEAIDEEPPQRQSLYRVHSSVL